MRALDRGLPAPAQVLRRGAELNQAIRELLVRPNEQPFRKRDGSRREPMVAPLPGPAGSHRCPGHPRLGHDSAE